MSNRFLRNEMLFGKGSAKILNDKKVIVFGVGGVGGYVVEALARAGVGNIDIVDNDVVDISNINRQIIALDSTVGLDKVEVSKKRILDINPSCNVNAIKMFYLPENAKEIVFSAYDYIVDAIDTVTAKVDIAVNAQKNGVKIISSMGTGNKIDPTRFEVCDIYATADDKLAKAVRTACRKNNVKSLKVVYSREKATNNSEQDEKRIPASNSFVPPVAGFIIAGEVIKDLLQG